VVMMVRIGHQRLNVAVGSIARLGITHKHVRRIKSLLLSLRRVLSIYFQIVLIVIMRILLFELVILKNYRILGDVRHSVIKYISFYLNLYK